MTGKTHAVAAVTAAAYLGCIPSFTPETFVKSTVLIATAIIGGLLPDVDEPKSKMGNAIPYGRSGRIALAFDCFVVWYWTRDKWALIVAAIFLALAMIPHRSITHSLFALALAYMVTKGLASPYQKIFLIGYASHLALDIINPRGIPLLWPWNKHLSVSLVTTGSLGETVICLSLVGLLLLKAGLKLC
jgi:inner membrane protein